MEPFNPNPYHLLQESHGVISEVKRLSRYDSNIIPTRCLGYMKRLLSAAKSIPNESMPQEGVSNLERLIELTQEYHDSQEPVRFAKGLTQGRTGYHGGIGFVEGQLLHLGVQLLQEISDVIGEVYSRDEDWDFTPLYHDEPRFQMRIGESGRHLVAVDLGGQTSRGNYPITISTSIFNKNGDDSAQGHWETKYVDQTFATISRSGRLKIDKRKFRESYTKAVNALNS